MPGLQWERQNKVTMPKYYGWIDPDTPPVGYYTCPGGVYGLDHDTVVYEVKDHPTDPTMLMALIVFMPTSNMAEVALQPCLHDKVWVNVPRTWWKGALNDI